MKQPGLLSLTFEASVFQWREYFRTAYANPEVELIALWDQLEGVAASAFCIMAATTLSCLRRRLAF